MLLSSRSLFASCNPRRIANVPEARINVNADRKVVASDSTLAGKLPPSDPSLQRQHCWHLQPPIISDTIDTGQR
jgi:hypothetical protein